MPAKRRKAVHHAENVPMTLGAGVDCSLPSINLNADMSVEGSGEDANSTPNSTYLFSTIFCRILADTATERYPASTAKPGKREVVPVEEWSECYMSLGGNAPVTADGPACWSPAGV